MRRLFSQKGFTLLEIIIAVGIMAAMVITMTEITTGITLSRDRAKKRTEIRHGIGIGLSKMMDDVRQAFQANRKFHGRESRYVTGFKAGPSSMSFSTMSNIHFVKNRPDSDQISVGYQLQGNDKGNFDLIRRQTDYLTNDLEKGGKAFALVENVKDFALEFYDANKETWESQWDTNSVSSGGRLPRIVKVTMTVYGESLSEDGDPKEYYYELQIPVPMYKDKVNF